MSACIKHTTKSPDETFALARSLAKELKAGDVLLLIGDLGAGKTCFVQGLAEGLGVPGGTYVRSPSFALINEYRGGRLDLFHIDFYRLHEDADPADLGLDEYVYGCGVTAIEWADRFPDVFPPTAKRIEFRIVDEMTREIEISGK